MAERLDLAFVLKAGNIHRVGTLNLCMLAPCFAELSYFGHYQKYVGAATIKMIYLQLLVSNSLITLTRDLFILLTCRAAGSNFRMVRPSLMSVVKMIIHTQSVRQNFGACYF